MTNEFNGAGPVHAAVFVAEIGDVGRFPKGGEPLLLDGADTEGEKVGQEVLPDADQQTRLPPRSLVSSRGDLEISRWTTNRDFYARVAERRGRNIGRIAAARKLLTLVYYRLRDGEIRCLKDAA